jgi:hypothetical protein
MLFSYQTGYIQIRIVIHLMENSSLPWVWVKNNNRKIIKKNVNSHCRKLWLVFLIFVIDVQLLHCTLLTHLHPTLKCHYRLEFSLCALAGLFENGTRRGLSFCKIYSKDNNYASHGWRCVSSVNIIWKCHWLVIKLGL